jgi:hypothetical protein
LRVGTPRALSERSVTARARAHKKLTPLREGNSERALRGELHRAPPAARTSAPPGIRLVRFGLVGAALGELGREFGHDRGMTAERRPAG